MPYADNNDPRRIESDRRSKIKYNATHYNKNRAYQLKRTGLGIAFIDSIRASGCVDCGNKNLSVLQSDHVYGIKRWNISHMHSFPLWKIEEEMAKCETVCANCHQLRTRKRQYAKA